MIQDDGKVLELQLHLDETVALVGVYDLDVPKGIATVYGAVLHPGVATQRVYAPSTHALPLITSRKDGTCIRITSVASRIHALAQLSPLYRNIWTTDPRERSFTTLTTSADDPLQRALSTIEIDKDAQVVVARLAISSTPSNTPLRVMAVGAKSAGKSTFNRLLFNTIVTKQTIGRCQYLDLDPGQPEFGPPGQISLVEISAPVLGPPFSHPASATSTTSRLIRSHTIAATSFRDDTSHYLACVRELLRHVDGRQPLIVNSCGWVSGAGASVLATLASLMQLTDMVVMDPLEQSLVDSLTTNGRNTRITVHRIARQAPRPSSRTPAESRAMQTMAYFHHKPRASSPRQEIWNSTALSSHRPWVVSYASSATGVHAIASYGQPPDSEFFHEVLDGAVVALVAVEDETAYPVLRTTDGVPYISTSAIGIAQTLEPDTSECLGLALIRAIDTDTQTLQLVTPLSEASIARLMARKIILVRGAFDPPGWAYTEDLYHAGGRLGDSDINARPWVARAAAVGIEGKVWRLRHPPLAVRSGG